MEFDLFKEWLPSITEKKGYMFDGTMDEDIERKYPSFMINRALSQYEDTAVIANMLNEMVGGLDPKLQYDFLYYLVPKKRRFSKWARKEKESEEINIIIEAYQMSYPKAREILDILTEEDFNKLRGYLFKGGRSDRKGDNKCTTK